jgi:ribose 5-phosphate isomerase A
MNSDDAKRAAARAALRYLPEAGVIGLGSGSTAKFFVEAVAELVGQGRQLVGVPTSEQTRGYALQLGIPLLPDRGPWSIDVTVDGADEVSKDLDLIKGGGGCHTREKLVNQATAVNIIIVDESKLSENLGQKWPVPVEVLAFGRETTCAQLSRHGQVRLRQHSGEPWLTDAGNYLYDLELGIIQDPESLEATLGRIPGVVETGLFCGRATRVIVARSSGVFEIERSRKSGLP